MTLGFKIQLIIIFLLPFTLPFNVAHATEISDTTVDQQIDIVCDAGGDSIFMWDNPSQSGDNWEGRCDGSGIFDSASWADEIDGNSLSINTAGTYYVEVYDITGNITIESYDFVVSEGIVPPSVGYGLSGLVENAEGGFSSTTGVTQGAAVTWAGGALIKPFLGSAFSILYYMRYWILAVIIIFLIMYWIYPKAYPKRKI